MGRLLKKKTSSAKKSKKQESSSADSIQTDLRSGDRDENTSGGRCRAGTEKNFPDHAQDVRGTQNGNGR